MLCDESLVGVKEAAAYLGLAVSGMRKIVERSKKKSKRHMALEDHTLHPKRRRGGNFMLILSGSDAKERRDMSPGDAGCRLFSFEVLR